MCPSFYREDNHEGQYQPPTPHKLVKSQNQWEGQQQHQQEKGYIYLFLWLFYPARVQRASTLRVLGCPHSGMG